MRPLLSILLILSLSSIYGQGPEIEWQKSLGGTGYEFAYSVQQSSDGGYVIVGYAGSNDGDVTGNHGNADFWIVKLDASGDLIWQKCLGGTNSETATSVQQTTDGGYVVAGNSRSDDGDVTENHGIADFWIVKLDATGNLSWQKSLGGSMSETAKSVQQTTDGGFIIAGDTFSEDGDVTGNHGEQDVWIVKLDVSGDLIWQKCLGGTDGDSGSSIQQTTDGGYIIAGTVYSNDGDVIGNHGNSDVWIVKLDAFGDLIWQKCLGGSSGERGLSIQQTSDGGFIAAGEASSNDGDVTGNHGGRDVWIVKLDAVGDLIWQKCLGGTGIDEVRSVQQTTDEGYVVSGSVRSNDGDVTGNHGEQDVWIIKLDSDGILVWQKCLGGTDQDRAGSVQQTTDGGYIMAGTVYSNDGDVTGNHGEEDYWVVKLSPVVGIDEISETTFSIYPNPVSDKFTLSTEHEAIGQSYFIVDQLGKVLLEGKITSASMDFDISSFPIGIYYLSFQNRKSNLEIVKE